MLLVTYGPDPFPQPKPHLGQAWWHVSNASTWEVEAGDHSETLPQGPPTPTKNLTQKKSLPLLESWKLGEQQALVS